MREIEEKKSKELKEVGRLHLQESFTDTLSLQVTSTMSTKSGRKRAAEVGWEEIISGLIRDQQQRSMILAHWTLKAISPSSFLQLNEKSEFVEAIGMSGWEDQVTEQVATVCFISVERSSQRQWRI